MAQEPASRSGKKVDFRHPGGKEALIVGGVVLVAALVYFWYKNRQAAQQQQAAAQQGTGTPHVTVISPTGRLTSWIHDHQGQPSTSRVSVPNVVGQKAEVAVGVVKAAGLSPKLTVGTPKGRTGTITAETPHAGTKVAKNSVVTLHNTISGGHKGHGGGDGGGDS